MVVGNYRKFHCPARKAPLGDSHVGQSQCDRPLPLYGILSLHNVIGPYDFHIVLTVCGFPCRISEIPSLTPISCSEYDSRYTFYWIVLLLIRMYLIKEGTVPLFQGSRWGGGLTHWVQVARCWWSVAGKGGHTEPSCISSTCSHHPLYYMDFSAALIVYCRNKQNRKWCNVFIV